MGKRCYHIPPPSPAGAPAKWCTPCLVSGGLSTQVSSWVAPYLSATFLRVDASDSGHVGAYCSSCSTLDTPLRQPGALVLGHTTSQYSSEASLGTGALSPLPCPSHQWIPQSHQELKTGHISQGL